MKKLENIKRRRIKLTNDNLYKLVNDDRISAERYFDTHLKEDIVLRYNLLNQSEEYYKNKFPMLSRQCNFGSSDIKDIVEWLMPSLTEVYFGSENIVGVFGRSENDDPKVLEKVMQYQMREQNDSYNIIDQWCRDAVECGLGVVMLDWDRQEKKVKNVYNMDFSEFVSLDPNSPDVVSVETQDDGSYNVTIRETEVIRNQARLRNVKPSEFIYINERNSDGYYMYEAWRRFVPFDDVVRGIKMGVYDRVDIDSIPLNENDSEYANSMNDVFDAMSDYTQNEYRGETLLSLSESTVEGQEGRKFVVLYDHYGWYDVDGDGMLELTHVVTCNGVILKKEIVNYSHSPFFTISFYAKSYQRWKEAVADYLQSTQDLKTALMRQIVINTSQNNNRQFAIDSQSVDGIKDIIEGHQFIRINMTNARGVNDFIKPLPKFELDQSCFPLLEMLNSISEQKTGITKYNQGLDSDSLNKTATGIVKIMAASQQRLRKMARDGAENGIVPLYRHLIVLDKDNLKDEFTFRITDKYYRFTPEDIEGDYDVQINSNIGLQDKQLMVQNLMVILGQILPQLLQMGVASPVGVYNTAKQCVQEMGFNNADKFIGMNEEQLQQQQNLPAILSQSLQALGLAPDIIQAVVQQVMVSLQNPAAQQMVAQQAGAAQMAQMSMQSPAPVNDESDGRIGYKDARNQALSEMMG